MHAEVATCDHAISEMMVKIEEKKREEGKLGFCNIWQIFHFN